MDEDDPEELLEVVPEEMTGEELVELEQEHVLKKRQRKGNYRRRKGKQHPPPRKSTVKGFAKAFKLLKNSKACTPTPTGCH